MRAFIWTAVILGVLDCVAKAVLLYKGDATRNLNLLPLDIFLTILYMLWGMYLLGSNP